MFCTQCGEELPLKAKFCNKCGAPTTPVSNPPKVRNSRTRPEFSNPEGITQYESLLKAKHARTVKTSKIALILIWGCWLVWEGLFLTNASTKVSLELVSGTIFTHLIIALVLTFFALCLVGGVRLTEDEYYSLPGSRKGRGEHQCVHCGHPGVYIKGQYRTNFKHHSCSRCKKYHFTSNS